ncbi:NADH-dependent butanol dehydrogenase A [Mucinivorans hirudinis]|uniref:NADH-dependent butanol dehydrogenase A n=1 Tax=Mucinivorans hirudinis TaxID=1433126 RepID=A0A060R818_9BACT|nr:NADH-dependent butanol dehydrogenase A [Mucinivorans hirudinis]
MQNFTFQNPTKLVFGKGEIARLAKLVPADAKVMMTYGGGSIFKNGIYEQVKEALVNHNVTEFGGIEPNPEYNTLMRCVVECKSKGVDFLLAVGGGSVIDGTKFIATALKWEGDPWEFMIKPGITHSAVPLASVLTLPATGSEMNNGAVVSRRERNEKFAFHNPACFPVFSILDPTAIYSLPAKQVANGIIDTFAHTLEQYLTFDNKALIQDYWAEGILKTLIEIAPKLMENQQDYDTCANFMYAATMGLNGFIAMGVAQDWATHMIGHELTALHGLDHGVTLAIVHPGVMSVMREAKWTKLVQYAERVFGITKGTDLEKIEGAINATEQFYRSLGVATRLGEHNIGEATIAEIVRRFTERGALLGEGGIVTPEKVGEILNRVK